MFFHGIILHDYRFFFEVPRFEESQDPDSSPRREEVGRRTLGDYGGFLLSFFYRARFQWFTRHFSLFVEKPQKLPLTSLQTLWEYQNRLLLEEFYTIDEVISPEDDSRKKKHVVT